jgi:hypothetical protein
VNRPPRGRPRVWQAATIVIRASARFSMALYRSFGISTGYARDDPDNPSVAPTIKSRATESPQVLTGSRLTIVKRGRLRA